MGTLDYDVGMIRAEDIYSGAKNEGWACIAVREHILPRDMIRIRLLVNQIDFGFFCVL